MPITTEIFVVVRRNGGDEWTIVRSFIHPTYAQNYINDLVAAEEGDRHEYRIKIVTHELQP